MDLETHERVTEDYTRYEGSPIERLALDFAAKVARNAYKITAADADRFRSAGLGEEAYVEVMGTTAARLGIDRMANSLGVSPDTRPLLPSRV